MVTVPDGERMFAEELGRLARTQLPHLDWDEIELHLVLGWETSSHADNLRWADVCHYAHASWTQFVPGEP